MATSRLYGDELPWPGHNPCKVSSFGALFSFVPFRSSVIAWFLLLNNLPFLHKRRLLIPEIHLKLPAVGVFDDRRDCGINNSAMMQVDLDVVTDLVLTVLALLFGWHSRNLSDCNANWQGRT